VYNGGLGAEPPAESRGTAPGQGARRAKPPEADDIFILKLHFLRSSCGILHWCTGCKFVLIFNTGKNTKSYNYNCTNQHQLHTEISLGILSGWSFTFGYCVL